MLFGLSIAGLSFLATPAVDYDGGQLTEHEGSTKMSSDRGPSPESEDA